MKNKLETQKPDELTFIQAPDLWPQWPILPVVSRKQTKSGIVLEQGPTVYLINMWDKEALRNFSDCEKVEYDSYEKLLVDWRID